MAIPENDNATVEIKGNNNLDGNYNTVSVIVTAEDTKTTKTYNINVVNEQRNNDEEQQLNIYNENITNNSENVTVPSKDTTLIKVIVITVIVITLSLIVVIFIKKGKK